MGFSPDARSACTKRTPSAPNTFAVVVEAEDVERVVNDTCEPPEPEKATDGNPSFAASHAAPLHMWKRNSQKNCA